MKRSDVPLLSSILGHATVRLLFVTLTSNIIFDACRIGFLKLLVTLHQVILDVAFDVSSAYGLKIHDEQPWNL
jgi:hypothetical protein